MKSPEWHYKMEANQTKMSTMLRHFLKIYMQHRKRSNNPCFNYTNPYLEEQEELTASLYILIVIGFFGFLLFSLMISNIVNRKRENYVDYLYNGESRKHERHLPQINKAVIVAGQSILPEPSKMSKCEKTDSCATVAKTPSVEAVLKHV
ncbi:hypothetical protein lerEdw1_011821 [Lerista edwardsae]|nr:hypothetical protein lerEdw1_011821 [Lerista edwardsae]